MTHQAARMHRKAMKAHEAAAEAWMVHDEACAFIAAAMNIDYLSFVAANRTEAAAKASRDAQSAYADAGAKAAARKACDEDGRSDEAVEQHQAAARAHYRAWKRITREG